MGLKSVLSALIAGNWGDVTSPKRLPIKDREIGEYIRDQELYPEVHYENEENSEDTNIFTLEYPNLAFNIQFWKQGSTVFWQGTMQKLPTGGTITNIPLLNIAEGEFTPAAGELNRMWGADNAPLAYKRFFIKFEDNQVHLLGSVDTENTFAFCGHYRAEN